ncbi:MAG: M20 metallopeptidase family protein [Acidimicrobiales bacterium]
MSAVDELIATRRDLHRHPELAFEENRTARLVASRLRGFGLAVREHVGRTGVVADIGRPGRGPDVVVRAEMDGLPIDEAGDRPFRSTRAGVMHACGHDGHTAILLAVARDLAARANDLPGRVRLLFQPAEETGQGSIAMIEDGALDGSAWTGALALHLRPFMMAGSIGICRGPAAARVGEFDVEVIGEGGHGGRPHASVDALLAGVEIVTALQTLIPREVSALDSAVLSVCSFHGGTAANVMPASVNFAGTVRTAKDEVYDQLLGRAAELAVAVGRGFRCSVEMNVREMMPAVWNDPTVAAVARDAATAVVGADRVLEVEPVMAGDDVARIFERVPGCYVFLGAAHDDGRPPTPNHSPVWDFDERVLPIGASVLLEAVDRLLTSPLPGDPPSSRT